ncbi:MAG: serine hydrolase [Caldilineales bacterium]
MHLVEQGKIDVDAPLTTYLPDFTMADPRYTAITIRHLLADISGMPDWDESGWDYSRRATSAEALHEAIRSLATYELTGDPGEAAYLYSNAGFDILGDAVARVAGQPFEEYVQEQFLDPLGMTSSSFLMSDVDPVALTTLHWKDDAGNVVAGEEFVDYDQVHTPSGGLISNVQDMSQWMLFNLNRGELDGQRLLSPASYDAMWIGETDADWGIGGMFQDWGMGMGAGRAGRPSFRLVGWPDGRRHQYHDLAPDDSHGCGRGDQCQPGASYDTPWYAVDLATELTHERLASRQSLKLTMF